MGSTSMRLGYQIILVVTLSTLVYLPCDSLSRYITVHTVLVLNNGPRGPMPRGSLSLIHFPYVLINQILHLRYTYATAIIYLLTQLGFRDGSLTDAVFSGKLSRLC